MKLVHTTGRGPDGKFTKGNNFGQGRPPRHIEQHYTATIFDICSIEKWEAIVRRAVEDAIDGDAKAREWLGHYLLGVPKVAAKLYTQGERAREIDDMLDR